jgi:hypothetical protein
METVTVCKDADETFDDIEDFKGVDLTQIHGLWSDIEGTWNYHYGTIENHHAAGTSTCWMGKHVDFVEEMSNYWLTVNFRIKSRNNKGSAGIKWNIAKESDANSNGSHMSIEFNPRYNSITFESKSKTAKYSKTIRYYHSYNRHY